MSYVPAVWLLVFLVRILVRAVSGGGGSGWGGQASAAERKLGPRLFPPPPAIGLPIVVSLAFWVGGLPLPTAVLFLLVLLTLACGLYALFTRRTGSPGGARPLGTVAHRALAAGRRGLPFGCGSDGGASSTGLASRG
jgi:hypothetical protein